MKILITGASGFIGSFLVEKSLEQRFETYAGIRSSSSKKYIVDERIKFIDINYADKEKLISQLNEFKQQNGTWDYIIHNAGITKCNKKSDFDRINFMFTKNFVEALCETNMIPKIFVYISSLSAWGAGNEKTLEPIKLDDLPKPDTAYGKSKIKSENFIANIPDFPYLFIRPAGVYGPREKDYLTFVKSIKKGIVPSIGFKPQYLTFIYVKDLTKAIFLLIEKHVVGKSYFVSDGNVYTSKEYANTVKKLLGKKFTIKICIPVFILKIICCLLDTVYGLFGKSPTLNSDKYNILKARNWKCEIQPLQTDANFSADYDLMSGLKETIEFELYKKNQFIK
ncbi:MAG: NAD(P)-dependent oxidoreductase [Prevotellaceae bacterium]|jgi:nucleoside-diphosphate-sugar epimerase|nr:NAD(P)-dependent oxidoreductase [Prevotellaceae bacterium]